MILWKSKPVEEATWEEESSIRSQFTNFCLEEKAAFRGGGFDGIEDPNAPQVDKPKPKVL